MAAAQDTFLDLLYSSVSVVDGALLHIFLRHFFYCLLSTRLRRAVLTVTGNMCQWVICDGCFNNERVSNFYEALFLYFYIPF